MGCERKQGVIYTLPGLLTSPVPNQWGSEASGSGQFRVGRSVWRGRYKRSVSGGGQVIVCSQNLTVKKTVEVLGSLYKCTRDYLPT